LRDKTENCMVMGTAVIPRYYRGNVEWSCSPFCSTSFVCLSVCHTPVLYQNG